MPKKCESCRFYEPDTSGVNDPPFFGHGHCSNDQIVQVIGQRRATRVAVMPAREVCDKEGDGIFVHYREKVMPVLPAGQAIAAKEAM